jgi:Bacterial Ig-like domain (group 2)/Chitobiase/beta-hexosaminidase C-terminal domain
VPVGGATVLKAMAHLSDGTTQDVTAGTQWTLSNPALATMSNGALTAKAPGSLTVQAAYVETAPAGTSPASTTVSPQNLSASLQVTITSASGASAINVPTITWSAPADIAYGTALSSTQLNATANVAGTFAYTPAAGTQLKVGKQTLSATFTPTDTKTYSAATASVQLNVAQATPTVTWAAPAPIATGAALSATQLDATANVPGSFMYNPAVGAVLAAGTQQLTAVFSPTDTTDYSSVTAHTSLVVGSATPTPTPTPNPPAPVGCGGPTINLNSGMSQSTLQSSIANAPTCSLILFAAGTYNISAGLPLPCGVVISAAVPATPSNVVLSASFPEESTDIFTMNAGCTSATSISYLSTLHAGLIFVNAPNSNLTITHNQVGDLKCCNSQIYSPAIYFNDPSAGATNFIKNAIITYNQLGDSTSCTTPGGSDSSFSGNWMNDAESPEAPQMGECAGMVIQTSVNGVIFQNNNIVHVEEGVHLLCYGDRCSPGDPGGSGPVTYNVTAQYNDFNQIHRIVWEEQPEAISAVTYQYNSEHDWYDSYFGSFGISMACCANPASFAPYLNTSNNVIVFNTVGASRYGYGIEAFGTGPPQFTNNLIESPNPTGNAMTYGYNSSGMAPNFNYNTLCGAGFASAGYISQEFPNLTAPTTTGTVETSTCPVPQSATPTISPNGGSQSFPLTVTLTDAGFGPTTPLPNGNTGIWYTTDGSTPTPGSGSAKRLDSGGSFTLNSAATVKAVGMWGAANQPASYASGYGFVPSGVVTAAYTGGGAIKRPTGTASSSTSSAGKLAVAAGAPAELPAGAGSVALQSVAINPSQPVVGIGSTTQLKAIATFADGSVKDVTADFGWQSSDGRIATANGSGTLAGVASGMATISGSYQGVQASVAIHSTIGEVVWSDPIVITEGGTYSGNWQSTDAKTPAVTIATTAPVTIENARIRSVGSLMKTAVAGSNLTVRNSLGVALNAAVKGQPNGIFLEVTSPVQLDVENNYIENARGGVIVHGYAGNRDGKQTIVIRANRARNLNGLVSDGHGNYLPGEGANRSQAHFIQLDSVQSVPGIDVGWNEVVNYPGQSLVDDNIDVYRSGGTPNQPLEIHDTYIQGAYPYRAAQDAYDGGGIKTDAKAGDNAQKVPAFNSIHDNQVVGTTNYGIQFAAGHDNVAANNRIISSGLLADGTKIAAQQVGMANGDATGGGVADGSMYNNAMRDNLIGWMCWQTSCAQEGYRKDQSFPAAPADYSTNSVVAAGHITLEMENNEYQVWLNKMSAASVTVGPAF